ncbi:hypothetical protein CF328_g9066 [Tilletia controversa]|nr:hypothetical protein CF328_g9066 [Tilletia controversa]
MPSSSLPSPQLAAGETVLRSSRRRPLAEIQASQPDDPTQHSPTSTTSSPPPKRQRQSARHAGHHSKYGSPSLSHSSSRSPSNSPSGSPPDPLRAAIPSRATRSRNKSTQAAHVNMIQLLRDFHEDAGFIPEQWQLEVICCLAAGWDVVLSAGTGRGKSLIWEIAAFLHPDKIFLVIVPLQAIEIDQVSKYTKTSISAIALSQSVITGKLQDQTDSVAQASTTNSVSSARNDHTARAARKKLQRDLRDGVYQLIFASPEMLLQNPNISLLLSEPSFKNRVGGVFVDEAHVVEDWGYRVRLSPELTRSWGFADSALLRRRAPPEAERGAHF